MAYEQVLLKLEVDWQISSDNEAKETIESIKNERQKERLKAWRKDHKAERQNYRLDWNARNPNYHKNYFKSPRGKEVNKKAQKKHRLKKQQKIKLETKNNSK